MVARSDEHAVFGLAVDASEASCLDGTPLLREAQSVGDKDPAVVRRVRREEGLPVGLRVREGLREPHLVVVRAELPGEGRVRCVVSRHRVAWIVPLEVGPAPVSTVVFRNRRAAGADRGRVAEIEGERPSRGASHAERPVDPVSGRVAEVLFQLHDIAFDRLHDDVPRRNFRVDGIAVRNSKRNRRHKNRNQWSYHFASFVFNHVGRVGYFNAETQSTQRVILCKSLTHFKPESP